MSKKSEIPLEGFGKFIIGFLPAVRKILAPCAQHSQLACSSYVLSQYSFFTYVWYLIFRGYCGRNVHTIYSTNSILIIV